MSDLESNMDYERDEARAWFNEAPASERPDPSDYAGEYTPVTSRDNDREIPQQELPRDCYGNVAPF